MDHARMGIERCTNTNHPIQQTVTQRQKRRVVPLGIIPPAFPSMNLSLLPFKTVSDRNGDQKFPVLGNSNDDLTN
eukprot:snap_masked-scaffold_7-processed-gene-1.17-mRNA-1 protein AED:1.00 eAED:1.00 QI:0/0/0/0/1/1/2/0/74